VAHGFRREKGAARGYVNETNPDFSPGHRLSRRQYDAYADRLGARTHRPRMADLTVSLTATQQTLRDTQAELDRLARELAASGRAQTRGQMLVARRRQREAMQSARETEALLTREDRTVKGLRRYHAALQSYVEEQRSRGRDVSARQAAKDPAFREAIALLKGKPNPRGSVRIRQANAEGRKRAIQALGGSAAFKEVYDRRYGQRVTRIHRSGAGDRIRRRNVG
jgi:hypothetical protein